MSLNDKIADYARKLQREENKLCDRTMRITQLSLEMTLTAYATNVETTKQEPAGSVKAVTAKIRNEKIARYLWEVIEEGNET